MRFRTAAALLTTAAIGLAGCSTGAGASDPNGPLRVAVSPQPHGEILEFVDEELAEQAGLDLEVETFSDYNRPNEALTQGELQANYYQHRPFLEEYRSEKGGEFAWVQSVHLEPIAAYSKEHGSLQDIPQGGKVTLPNDPANRLRGLKLLADNGVLTLKPDVAEDMRVEEAVAENPKNLELSTLSPDQLPRTVEEADAAIVNGNYALKANLNSPLAIESVEGNPYVNGLVTTPQLREDPRVVKLAELLRSPEVAEFIRQNYTEQTVVPAA